MSRGYAIKKPELMFTNSNVYLKFPKDAYYILLEE